MSYGRPTLKQRGPFGCQQAYQNISGFKADAYVHGREAPSRDTGARLQLSPAKPEAIARPMPFEAPVTTAILAERRKSNPRLR
jgi:hypothetical protein